MACKFSDESTLREGVARVARMILRIHIANHELRSSMHLRCDGTSKEFVDASVVSNKTRHLRM